MKNVRFFTICLRRNTIILILNKESISNKESKAVL
jgi:hypothetical protein